MAAAVGTAGAVLVVPLVVAVAAVVSAAAAADLPIPAVSAAAAGQAHAIPELRALLAVQAATPLVAMAVLGGAVAVVPATVHLFLKLVVAAVVLLFNRVQGLAAAAAAAVEAGLLRLPIRVIRALVQTRLASPALRSPPEVPPRLLSALRADKS
jgi:hypothetical protein